MYLFTQVRNRLQSFLFLSFKINPAEALRIWETHVCTHCIFSAIFYSIWLAFSHCLLFVLTRVACKMSLSGCPALVCHTSGTPSHLVSLHRLIITLPGLAVLQHLVSKPVFFLSLTYNVHLHSCFLFSFFHIIGFWILPFLLLLFCYFTNKRQTWAYSVLYEVIMKAVGLCFVYNNII